MNKSKIVAAYYETQNSFGKGSLQRVVEHALKHEAVVGGWLNIAILLISAGFSDTTFMSNPVFLSVL